MASRTTKCVLSWKAFESGELPNVSIVSGNPATELRSVKVQITRIWPWLFFLSSPLTFLMTMLLPNRYLEGYFPVVDRESTETINAVAERGGVGVIVEGAHPAFIAVL